LEFGYHIFNGRDTGFDFFSTLGTVDNIFSGFESSEETNNPVFSILDWLNFYKGIDLSFSPNKYCYNISEFGSCDKIRNTLHGFKISHILLDLGQILYNINESLLSLSRVNEGLLDLIEPDLALRGSASAVRVISEKFLLEADQFLDGGKNVAWRFAFYFGNNIFDSGDTGFNLLHTLHSVSHIFSSLHSS